MSSTSGADPTVGIDLGATLPAVLALTFTSDWSGPFNSQDLTVTRLAHAGYRLSPGASSLPIRGGRGR